MKKLYFITACAFILSNSYSQTVTNASVSCYFSGFKACTPPDTAYVYATVFYGRYAMGDQFTVKLDFTDGSDSVFTSVYDTTSYHKSFFSFNTTHIYSSAGVYSPIVTITDKNNITVSYASINPAIESDVCNNIKVRLFYDKNNNCVYDAGDSLVMYPYCSATLDVSGASVNSASDGLGNAFVSIPLGLAGVLQCNPSLPTGYAMRCSSYASFTATLNQQSFDFAIQQVVDGPPPAFVKTDPKSVLVVYRDDDYLDFNKNGISDSKELAEYYQAKRNIPASNLLGVTLIQQNYWYGFGFDMDGWKNFVKNLVYPIKNKIQSLGGDTSIKYIVLCGYGIPEGINVTNLGILTAQYARSTDGMLVALNDVGDTITPKYSYQWDDNPYYESTPTKGGDNGPFSHSKYRLANKKTMYLVSRFDGMDFQAWRNEIDMALYGEKYIAVGSGYYNGMAYSDSYETLDSNISAGYPYQPNVYNDFDKNATYIQTFYQNAGIPFKHENTGSVIGRRDSSGVVVARWDDGTPADSARKAMLYGGWYNYGDYENVFDWIPGAFGSDLNSCSASTVGIGSVCWLANAFRHGLTCGTGVITEPYLPGQSQPDKVIYYLLQGYDFMSAAYAGQPDIKWMGVVIGDPLYNPFDKTKTPVIDNVVQPSTISYSFVNDSTTTVFLDYNTTLAAPEVVKAQLMWGNSTAYTKIKKSDTIYYAHHVFQFTNLKKDSIYHFQICVHDPVGNTWCSYDNMFTPGGSFTTGEKKIGESNALTVFPNPSNGSFNVAYELAGNSTVRVDVLNSLGEVVYSDASYGNKGTYSNNINLSGFAKGIYQLRFSNNDHVINKRIEIF